ncbi:hypothetical protein ES703_63255 [subsurface metagenome]
MCLLFWWFSMFFENSGPSREVYVDFGLVTTVNEGSTKNSSHIFIFKHLVCKQ